MSQPVPTPPGPGRVGRRLVLGAGTATALTVLAGCGIRLEDDAPDLPLVPRRTPVPAEQALLDLLAGSRLLTSVTGDWTAGQGAVLGPALSTIHRRQSDVLAAILLAADVPASLVNPASTSTSTGSATPATKPTSSPTSTGSPTSTAPVTASDVAALERQPLAEAGTLAGSAGVMRPTVAAILAQRYAATVLTGGRTPTLGRAATPTTPMSTPTAGTGSGTGPSSGPWSGPPTTGTATGTASGTTEESAWPATSANTVVEATRSAYYGLQVVTARSSGAQRALGAATLRELAALDRDQTPRLTTTPPTVLGYELPYAVTTPAAARRLAVRILTDLRAAYGSLLPVLETVEAQVFLDLAEWLGRVEIQLRRWGGTLVPFPGMSA